MTDHSFSAVDFHSICDILAERDPHIADIISAHGYPPIWSRKEGFATLAYIILEQQVSLASARSAYDKLIEKIGTITPSKVLTLTDEELKGCYFSRQKINYVRELATAIVSKKISLNKLNLLPNDEIRQQLTAVKGIGNWTVDVYLMMVLHRSDLFPMGDIALINSLRYVKDLPKDISRADMEKHTEVWKPYRTAAAFLLWHSYIIRRKIKIAAYD